MRICMGFVQFSLTIRCLLPRRAVACPSHRQTVGRLAVHADGTPTPHAFTVTHTATASHNTLRYSQRTSNTTANGVRNSDRTALSYKTPTPTVFCPCLAWLLFSGSLYSTEFHTTPTSLAGFVDGTRTMKARAHLVSCIVPAPCSISTLDCSVSPKSRLQRILIYFVHILRSLY